MSDYFKNISLWMKFFLKIIALGHKRYVLFYIILFFVNINLSINIYINNFNINIFIIIIDNVVIIISIFFNYKKCYCTT